MNDVFYKDKLIWEHKIRTFEKEFLTMFPNIKLPNYKIIFVQDIENIKYSMQVLHVKSPMLLNVNIGFMLDKSFDYKSDLAHEFTHMNDYYSLLNDKDEKFKSKALFLYTEYHATYIQGQYLLQKSPDSIIQKIKENELLIQENVKSFNNNPNLDSWSGILFGYMYYFGYIDCYNSAYLKYEMKHFDFQDDSVLYDLYNCISLLKEEELPWELCHKIQLFLDANVLIQLCK